VHVAYRDAEAYAKWAGKRLPTEAEWEFAARGGLSGQLYAWGDDLKPGGKWPANIYEGKFPISDTGEDGFKGIAPVAQYAPNGYGLYDVAGNVWEWCSDWYWPDTYQRDAAKGVVRNPQGPPDSHDPTEPGAKKRLHRGGSFLCTDQYCTRYMVGTRGKGEVDTGTSHLGFRCVREGGATSPMPAVPQPSLVKVERLPEGGTTEMKKPEAEPVAGKKVDEAVPATSEPQPVKKADEARPVSEQEPAKKADEVPAAK
jgi:hypothetical protein